VTGKKRGLAKSYKLGALPVADQTALTALETRETKILTLATLESMVELFETGRIIIFIITVSVKT